MEMTLIFGINEYLEANPAYDSLIFRVHGHHLMVRGCFGNSIFVLVTLYHKGGGEIMHRLELKRTSLNFRETWQESNISLLNVSRIPPAVCFTTAVILLLRKFRNLSLKIICWQSERWGLFVSRKVK